MLVGITTKKLCDEYGIHTWKYDLESPTSDENDPTAFCGSFFLKQRFEDSDSYFNWENIEFDESSDNLEVMKVWIESHHEELENALNKGCLEIETE